MKRWRLFATMAGNKSLDALLANIIISDIQVGRLAFTFAFLTSNNCGALFLL